MIQVPLSNSARPALIDDEDASITAGRAWRVNAHGYVSSNLRVGGKQVLLLLHRLVMKTPAGEECDHIHHDKLDNRKSELRNGTKSLNQRNRKPKAGSRFKGIYFEKSRNRWKAQIHVEGKVRNLGRFVDETEAAVAYNTAAKEIFKDHALLNTL